MYASYYPMSRAARVLLSTAVVILAMAAGFVAGG